MKKKAISLLFALLLLFSIGMAVSASPVPNTAGETTAISQSETVAPASDDLENPGADSSAVQGVSPSGPEAPDGEEQAAEETQTDSAPQKSNNTPFFIGAGIAVLLFIGVALYCKANCYKPCAIQVHTVVFASVPALTLANLNRLGHY